MGVRSYTLRNTGAQPGSKLAGFTFGKKQREADLFFKKRGITNFHLFFDPKSISLRKIRSDFGFSINAYRTWGKLANISYLLKGSKLYHDHDSYP